MRRRCCLLVVTFVALAGLAPPATATAGDAPTVQVRSSSYGRILVDGRG
jgi:hypothetical protein